LAAVAIGPNGLLAIHHLNNNNNNYNNLFIIYVASQQLQANYTHSTVLIQLHYGHTKYVYNVKDKLQASTGGKTH
jgi:hypothetical protein